MRETHDEDLGRIQLTKRKQSKRISVRYDPDGRLKVSLPPQVSYKAGLDYVLFHKQQIKAKVIDLQVEQYSHDLSHFHTRWHRVKVQKEQRETIEYIIDPEQTLIKIPRQMDQKDMLVQQAIRKALEETLRIEAKIYLPRRLNELANQYNLSYNNIYIKKAQSLWGSCSSKNNINLNIHLMRLPDHLIDYVLSHELCHILHKNHSKRFWDYLQHLMDDDVDKLRKELNQYSPKLI